MPQTELYDNNRKWSPTEKAIARKAFDQALQREFHALIDEVKQMARDIEEPSQVWELERHLTKRRKEIDETYDYRYSVVLQVFGTLIYQGRLREEELRGLADEKLDWIRRVVAFASEQ